MPRFPRARSGATLLFIIVATHLNCLVAVGATAPATTPTSTADRDSMIDGVRRISAPGIPGPLCVFGDRAFTVVAATCDGVPAPLVAAATLGNGRVVAFGHEGYFSRDTLAAGDTKRLIQQVAVWVAGNRHAQREHPTRVGTFQLPNLAAGLDNRAFKIVAIDPPELPRRLDEIDVLFIRAGDIREEDVKPLESFISRGGGIVAGMPGWGWLQLHPGKSLAEDLPAQELFSKAGVAWADGELDVPPDRHLAVSHDPPSPWLNARLAFDESLRRAPKDESAFDGSDIAVRAVLRCLDAVPSADHFRAFPQNVSQIELPREFPTPEKPMSDADGVVKVLVAIDTRAAHRTKPEDLEDAVIAVTGKLPEPATRVSREVEIDSSVPGWHSTGLYEIPGQLVTVTPLSALSNTRKLQFRIGAHADSLWHLKQWKRAPHVDRTFELDGQGLKAANFFGGSIYLVVPDDAPKQQLRFRIDGGVDAPYFVLGKTDAREWRDRIRNAPAPWAELQGEKIILTLPSEHVRKLDDPAELMRFWDRVADACADLAAIPRERKRPERYVADVQISAGYMHAGYPIMTHLDAAPRFVDLPALQRDGEWGMFHEIGHNHQNPDWTFDGTGEVTVNLFTMYVLDTVCTNGGKMHKAMSPEARAERTKKYKDNGTKFEDWKRDPFLALIMYKQLQEAFGWDAYKKVFAEYRALKPDERPKTDDEKRDQWLVRMSRTVGRNLSRFFEYWGVPTSESARKSIGQFPEWMPAQE